MKIQDIYGGGSFHPAVAAAADELGVLGSEDRREDDETRRRQASLDEAILSILSETKVLLF